MPKKLAKKVKSSKESLSQTTLFWLSVFFMLFAVFVILMYNRQVQDAKALIKYQEYQRDASMKLVVPVATPKTYKK